MIKLLEHFSYEYRLSELGLFSLLYGEEKALGRLYCGLPVPKGGLQVG